MARNELWVIGNWKMNKTLEESEMFIRQFLPQATDLKCKLCLFVPYLDIKDTLRLCAGSKLKIGAQNCHAEDRGAYTGEVSAQMLSHIGVNEILLGHSERRKHFHESDEDVNKKLKKVLTLGMTAVVCVGESEEQRDAGTYFQSVSQQLDSIFAGIHQSELSTLLIAYEPVWAIGTGKTANCSQIFEMIEFIKKYLNELYPKRAQMFKVIYGGSIVPENCRTILSIENLDGLLVGGASLDCGKFLSIAKAADEILKNRGATA